MFACGPVLFCLTSMRILPHLGRLHFYFSKAPSLKIRTTLNILIEFFLLQNSNHLGLVVCIILLIIITLF